jgi:hypothetical protein
LAVLITLNVLVVLLVVVYVMAWLGGVSGAV